MSLTQDHLDSWLRLDVERYFRGHEPRSIGLAPAPLLEKGRVNLVCECTETPASVLLKNAMSLTGPVTGHPERADEELVATTRLVWLDRNGKWARIKQRLYRLGDRYNAAEDQ